MLEVKNLSKSYGKHQAVKNLNFTIEKGSFTAILGTNGAGKSTTLQMLMGLLPQTSGQVIYHGDIHMGAVFQNSVLDDILTVRENLLLRQIKASDKNSIDLEELIEHLGLTSFANQAYGTLSGGQKRRVDIARALLNHTDLLFLDEPTTGLDIQTRTAIWQFLRELQEKYQLTIVLTTHYLDEVEGADMIYIINEGQLVASGSAYDIKNTYAPSQLSLHVSSKDALLSYLQEKKMPHSILKDEQIQVLQLTAHQVTDLLWENKDNVINFNYRNGNMDDAFMALTGKEMK